MKKLLTIFCLVLLVSCSNEIPFDELVYRNGLYYEVNSTTPFTGSSVSYYENGRLKSKRHFREGVYDGDWEWFYPNGQLSWRINFKDGEQDGLWEGFDENGNLTKTEEYKDGVLQE